MTAIVRFGIGDFTITPISDGFSTISPANFQGIGETECNAIFERVYGTPGPYHGYVNAFVVDTGGDVYLIDTGSGCFLGPNLGRLGENLRAAGYEPSRISALIFTHLHPDHVGGSVKDGKAVFENAAFIVGRTEHAFWSDPEMRARFPEARRFSFDLAVSALAAYADRLRIIGDSDAVFPGITAVPLPGHTPGHTGYRIESGDSALLVWADIVHSAYIQLPRPDVTILFDVDQPLAADTRLALLKQVTAERIIVAGMHLPFPGIGYIEPTDEAYQFVPVMG